MKCIHILNDTNRHVNHVNQIEHWLAKNKPSIDCPMRIKLTPAQCKRIRKSASKTVNHYCEHCPRYVENQKVGAYGICPECKALTRSKGLCKYCEDGKTRQTQQRFHGLTIEELMVFVDEYIQLPFRSPERRKLREEYGLTTAQAHNVVKRFKPIMGM